MAIAPKVYLRTVQLHLYVLSVKKLWNFLKAVASFYLARWSKRPIRWGYPFLLMVEPTNFCNLECPLCPSGNGTMTRPRGCMKYEHFRKLVDEAGEYLFLIFFWNQGEPFINKSLLEMVAYAREKRIATTVSTNAHLILDSEDAQAVIDSGLSEVIISLDGATAESYAKYRVGGNFETVLNCIRLLSSQKKASGKKNPIIHVQFLVMKHNEHETARIKEMARELGADKFSYKTTQVYTFDEAEEFLPSDEEMRRYETDSGELVLKAHFKKSCRRIWFNSMVNWEGSVTPCCFDKDATFTLGNAFDGKAFGDIWRSASYQRFRESVLLERESIDMCRNCSEGLKVSHFNRVEWIEN